MSELTTYRIDFAAHDAYDGSCTGDLPDPISFLVDDGVLVPDTRLQAIAEAWKAYRQRQSEPWLREEVESMTDFIDLLDALTKEDTVEDK